MVTCPCLQRIAIHILVIVIVVMPRSISSHVPDATFLEVHRAELQEAERVIAKADANRWVRQSEMNARKRTSLINIVTTLEASHG